MGFCDALSSRFSVRALNDARWAWVHDNSLPMGTPQDKGISDWRTSLQVRPATKNLCCAADRMG